MIAVAVYRTRHNGDPEVPIRFGFAHVEYDSFTDFIAQMCKYCKVESSSDFEFLYLIDLDLNVTEHQTRKP